MLNLVLPTRAWTEMRPSLRCFSSWPPGFITTQHCTEIRACCQSLGGVGASDRDLVVPLPETHSSAAARDDGMLTPCNTMAEDQKLYGSSAIMGFFVTAPRDRTRSSSFAEAVPAKAATTTVARQVSTAKRGPPWLRTIATAVIGK